MSRRPIKSSSISTWNNANDESTEPSNAAASGTNSQSSSPPPTRPICSICKLVAIFRVAISGANRGRSYYYCSRGHPPEFISWADNAGIDSGNPVSKPSSSTTTSSSIGTRLKGADTIDEKPLKREKDRSDKRRSSISSLNKFTESDDQDDSMFSMASEASDTATEVNPIPLNLRRLFLAHLLYEFFRCYSINGSIDLGTRQQANTSTVQRTNNTVTTTTATNDAGNNSSAGQLKRKLNDRDKNNDNEKEDDDGRQRKQGPSQRKLIVSSDGDSSLQFACPFLKCRPINHAGCEKNIMRAIARVKQHLWRKHRIPIHCPSCNITFKTEPERNEHQRQRPSCEVRPPILWDGITKEQEELLHRRSGVKKSTEEQWYAIFRILFPNEPLPETPYMDRLKSHQLTKLQEFMGQEWPRIGDDLMTQHMPDELREQESVIRHFTNALFQNAMSVLLRGFDDVSMQAQSTGSPNSGFQSRDEHAPSGDAPPPPLVRQIDDAILDPAVTIPIPVESEETIVMDHGDIHLQPEDASVDDWVKYFEKHPLEEVTQIDEDKLDFFGLDGVF